MQTIGVNPALIAASALRLTIASVSPNSRRPLGVPDDGVVGSGFFDHAGRHLAREGALALPVKILCGHADVRVARRVGDGAHRRQRRRESRSPRHEHL